MYASVVTAQVLPDKMDEAIRVWQGSVMPAAREQKGFKSARCLVDRKTDKIIAVVAPQSRKASRVRAAIQARRSRKSSPANVQATFATNDIKGGPEQSLDKIFVFPGTDLISVGEAGPGNPEYNSGRWDVHEVTFEREGVEHLVTGRWLIDASGRAGLIKRKLDLAQPNDHDANAIWFRIGTTLPS